MKMINLLSVQTILPTLKTKMIKLWCSLHQEKNQWKKSVNLLQDAEFLHKYGKEKDFQFVKTHLPHWKKMCQETRVSHQKKSRFWAANQIRKI